MSHLDEETLSALLDDRLTAADAAHAQSHLRDCADCSARLDATHRVRTLLGALPELDPPRDFTLGPRAVEAAPPVARLQRVYLWTRVAAGAMAASFVLLTLGALYTGRASSFSQPAVTQAPAAPRAVPAAKPAASPAALAPAAQPQGRSEAPAAASHAAQPADRASPEPEQTAAGVPSNPVPVQPATPSLLAAVAVAAGILLVVLVAAALVLRVRLRRAQALE